MVEGKRIGVAKTHKDLILWKKSIDFVTLVYSFTESFPKTEIYGISNQIRRSAVSIPSNIAEGYARKSDKELIQFLYISLGSIAELDTQLLISKNLSYLLPTEYDNLNSTLVELSKMTTSLIRSISSTTK